MACQIFQWLIAGTDRTTLEHASIGIGCLLLVDRIVQWRKRRTRKDVGIEPETSVDNAPGNTQRRAA
jgi:hypothetical protein